MGWLMILRPELRTLLNAKAVLLVDNDISEIGKLNLILEQSVGTNEDIDLARCCTLKGCATLPRFRLTSQYGQPDV